MSGTREKIMRVLITGGGGFLGTKLAAALAFTGAVAACAPPQSAETAAPSDPASEATATALAGSVFKGEWAQGSLYQITFPASLSAEKAEVYVIDSDAKRTEYRLPARVKVAGGDVRLKFEFDRTDFLTYDAESDRLTGLTEFKGERKGGVHIWATRAE